MMPVECRRDGRKWLVHTREWTLSLDVAFGGWTPLTPRLLSLRSGYSRFTRVYSRWYSSYSSASPGQHDRVLRHLTAQRAHVGTQQPLPLTESGKRIALLPFTTRVAGSSVYLGSERIAVRENCQVALSAGAKPMQPVSSHV